MILAMFQDDFKSQNEAKLELKPVSEQSVMIVTEGEHGVDGISCI
jgi:hypothetical protein